MIHFLHFPDLALLSKEKTVIFLNNNKVISLADVMGGNFSLLNETTKEVLVECAYFNPEAIIDEVGKYNLNSDAEVLGSKG